MKREVIKKLLIGLGISCELCALVGMFILSWQAGVVYCAGTVIGTIMLLIGSKIITPTTKTEAEQKNVIDELVKTLNKVIHQKGYTVGTVEFVPVIPEFTSTEVQVENAPTAEIVTKKKTYKKTKRAKVVKQ